ncbi:MAG: DUF1097 domain-containing protein [Anaeromicrobium sp.]|jgi:hypothetical protein|uniref:DUF1097 domain-containing protein n=1 Tax=Anaeromicrobium sp. TaxID=1929132 RepID=UPI0025DD2E2E|nr:DUF1097 domain-containing protein [Anaeromicrobium sp.]MCT4595288.1 DUF1097 domain-containing protein [Anaeromicrobium sp.]
MNIVIAIGIASGILACGWVMSSISLGFITFAGFFGWSSFFVAGGSEAGIKKTLINNLSGVFWGILAVKFGDYLSPIIGTKLALGIANGMGSAIICWMSRYKPFSSIPASFIGCSTYFATNFNIMGTIVGLIIGQCIGLISVKLTDLIAKSKSSVIAE